MTCYSIGLKQARHWFILATWYLGKVSLHSCTRSSALWRIWTFKIYPPLPPGPRFFLHPDEVPYGFSPQQRPLWREDGQSHHHWCLGFCNLYILGSDELSRWCISCCVGELRSKFDLEISRLGSLKIKTLFIYYWNIGFRGAEVWSIHNTRTDSKIPPSALKLET